MVSDEQLKEIEEIGENLPRSSKVSQDAPDIFFLQKLMKTRPDLVPRAPYDYYKMFEKHLQKKEGYTSQKKIAASEGLGSSGSLYAPFKRIREAIADMRKAEGMGPVKELPSMDTARLIEIYKKGKLVQLDPRALLPPKGHKHYELSRYFQKRRGPRQHSLEVLAESIGRIGMYEPPTIQDAGSHNGFIQRPDDGFSRLQSWIMADENAGGTDKKPVLEYPVCLLVDCTNAEGELIALQKNQNKDNFDIGDRDYSMVVMHERHPEVYTNKALAELNNLKPATVSGIIGAWRESWPCDEKKGETKESNPIRKALESRKITTYHGRGLARLKKWPEEQKRVGLWLLQEIDRYQLRDAHYRDYWATEIHRDIDEGTTVTKFDNHGISAGTLMKMVRQVETKMAHISHVQKTVTMMLKDGIIGEKIHEDKVIDLRAKISKEHTKYSDGITQDSFKKGLRAAGVSITTVQPKAKDMKPSSPASPSADASSQTTVLTAETVIHESEPEPETVTEPIKVCANCRFALDDGEDYSCQIGQEPNEENECAIQFYVPGSAPDTRFRCHYCGGITIPHFIEQFDVKVYDTQTEDGFMHRYHTLCEHFENLKELDVKGECHKCAEDRCNLLSVVSHMDVDVTVNHCPRKQDLPEYSIKEINKEVQKQLDHFVKQCQEDYEKVEQAETTVVAAGRSD